MTVSTAAVMEALPVRHKAVIAARKAGVVRLTREMPVPLLPPEPSLPAVHPSTVVQQLRSGDLLLFAGRGLVSDTVRVFTRSVWSHIGMVVYLPGITGPLVLEATTLSESDDVFRGAPVRGIGLVPFANKISEYPGEIALRQRAGPPLCRQRERRLQRLVCHLRHRPYKNYLYCHVRGWLTGRQRGDYDAMFCSELVAELYRRMGWLEKDIRPRDFVPGSFAEPAFALRDGCLAPPLRLVMAAAGQQASLPLASHASLVRA